MSATGQEGIAAGVGAGIDRRGSFRPVAAWAWMWRSFDTVLPDVTDVSCQCGHVPAESPSEGEEALPRAAEAAAYARYTAHGPW